MSLVKKQRDKFAAGLKLKNTPRMLLMRRLLTGEAAHEKCSLRYCICSSLLLTH